jgi:hypothetical protein
MPQNQFENRDYQIALIREKAKSDVSLALLRLGNDYSSLQTNNDITADKKNTVFQTIVMRSVGVLYKIYETRNRALETLGITEFESFSDFIKLENLPTGIYVSDLEFGQMLDTSDERIRGRDANLHKNSELETEYDKAFEEWQKREKN